MKQNTTNKKIGNDFESFFCELLFSNGFWVHNLAQNQAGQPADVIAVRNEKAFLIDCKDCIDDRFVLSRVEENQHLAMELWEQCGNGQGWFAIKIEGEIYMIDYGAIRHLSKTIRSLKIRDMTYLGIPIGEWVKMCK